MMQLDHGLGSITVVTDADLWKTPAIDQYDNAWLLWYLTRRHRRDAAVQHRTRQPADLAAGVISRRRWSP